MSEFLKIIKTYAKIRSPKILKGGGVIIIYKTVSAYDINVKSNVEAYLDPQNFDSYSQKGGLWIKMDDNMDYEINRKEGWIRLNNVGSNEAVAIAYTLGAASPSASATN